jgi:PAS domain S-box-containing protein
MTGTPSSLLRTADQDTDLQAALEAGGLGTWHWDILGGTIRWSESLEHIHGLTPGTFPGTFEAFLADVHPDDRARLQQELQRALVRGVHEVEYRIVRPDGEPRWVSGKGIVVYAPSGQPERMLGVCMDITDRKRAEEALEGSEHRYRELVADLGVAIYTTDAEGHITLFNEAAADLWGRRPRLGQDRWCGSWRLYYPDGSRMPHEACPLAVMLRTGEPVLGAEIIAERPDGTKTWIIPHPALLHDEAGRVTGAVNVLVDVSKRRRAEGRQAFITEASVMLSQSLDLDTLLERLARLVVGDLADWCSIDFWTNGERSDDGRIERVALAHADPAHAQIARRLRRYVHTANAAKGVLDALRDGEPLLFDSIDAEQLKGAAMNEDHLAIMTDLGFHSVMIVPMRARGRLLGGIMFIRGQTPEPYTLDDVALAQDLARRAAFAIDNARLFQEAQVTQERLRKASEAKDEFLGLISHELRTPITTIYGGARLLGSRWQQLDDDAKSVVIEGIEQETERLHHLVEDLLALSRLELDQKAELEPVLLRRILDKVATTFRRRGARVELSVPEQLYTVGGNPSWLEQVLRNLFGNALKYAGESAPITVKVTPGSDELIVSVLDRGPGVAAGEIERIFDTFYRSAALAKRASGAGIGLTVCRRLIEAQGGRIWARQRDGGGLEVSFALPLFQEDPE